MVKRIKELLNDGVDFALETTLANRGYVSFIKKAQQAGYEVTLLYFWLSSPEAAANRVATRVSKGGHNIPPDVIKRRYYRSVHNLIHSYKSICDNWLVINNMTTDSVAIAKGTFDLQETVIYTDIWKKILTLSHDKPN